MAEYLDNLNAQQRDAVVYSGGHSLVIAGAGSGKTRVLTCKIMYLLDNGLTPDSIMALTFTNKAANEMKQRIAQLVGTEAASNIWMGTFHSVFLRVLRTHAQKIGLNSKFSIYDSSDSRSLIKSIIKELALDEKTYPVKDIANAISHAKNRLITPEDYCYNTAVRNRDLNNGMPSIGTIYAKYQNRCRLSGAMDFDDILLYSNILFRDFPDVRDEYRKKFRYILVDEYQDTNFAQHLLVRQLCVDGGATLFAVGDDAQSIYAFRGANINNIIGLQKQFGALQLFKLERNYRSSKIIVEAANSLIAKNRNRLPKTVYSENETGERIPVVEASSEIDEGTTVAKRIFADKMRQGCKYSDFAILYRTNAQSRALEEGLRKCDIPYRIIGGQAFYQRKEVKDALSYFRLAVNPEDDEAICKIINFPQRGIGDTTIEKLRRQAGISSTSIWKVLLSIEHYGSLFNSGTMAKLLNFRRLIEKFVVLTETMNAYELATVIFDDTAIRSSLRTTNIPENISKIENLDALLSAVQEFVEQSAVNESTGMEDFLSKVSLLTSQDDVVSDDSVVLMTIHSAKGLEFKNVYIVGLEDDLFPLRKSSINPAELEEERRLLYVAVTRAMKKCTLSYCRTRFRNGTVVYPRRSQFISDFAPEYLVFPYGKSYMYAAKKQAPSRLPSMPSMQQTNASSSSPFAIFPPSTFKEGLIVVHEKFGKGTVQTVEHKIGGTKIIVDFESVGLKTLLTNYARLQIVD